MLFALISSQCSVKSSSQRRRSMVHKWFRFIPASVWLLSHDFNKWWRNSSIFPKLTFSTDPKKQIPWNFLNWSFFFFFFFKIQDSFPVHLQIAAAFQAAHLLLESWFRFLIRRPSDKRGERRGWRRGRGKRKDPYRMLSTGQWIFPTIQMYLQNAWVIHYSRFWSVTMDLRNEWWYLFADFISLILLIPLACVPLLIRK